MLLSPIQPSPSCCKHSESKSGSIQTSLAACLFFFHSPFQIIKFKITFCLNSRTGIIDNLYVENLTPHCLTGEAGTEPHYLNSKTFLLSKRHNVYFHKAFISAHAYLHFITA